MLIINQLIHKLSSRVHEEVKNMSAKLHGKYQELIFFQDLLFSFANYCAGGLTWWGHMCRRTYLVRSYVWVDLLGGVICAG